MKKTHIFTGSQLLATFIMKQCFNYNQTCIEMSPFKTGDLLKEVRCIYIFYGRTRRRWPFNAGDCLTEVTIWAGLTTCCHKQESNLSNLIDRQ